jgi:hypothetical protein
MSNNKFWMYDVTQLFSSFDLLPNSEDSLAAKLNSIMRLTILMCAIIAVYKPIIALSTLITVVAITTSVFSASSKQPVNEGFQEELDSARTLDTPIEGKLDHYMSLIEFMKEYSNQNHPLYKSGFPLTQKRFCNDEVKLNYGPDYFSMNQSLAGEPSMKTTIPPIVVAPSHDLSVWKENDFVTHSSINRETNFDYSRAGYSNGLLPTKCKNFCSVCIGVCTNNCLDQSGTKISKILQSSFDQSHKKKSSKNQSASQASTLQAPTLQARSEKSILRSDLRDEVDVSDHKRQTGSVLLPELIREMRRNNISENKIQKILDSSSATKNIGTFDSDQRRDNIITQTLQPGVYQKSHVGEPIQSNIGISYTQEFVPTEIDSTSNRIKYTQQNPNNLIITPTLREEVIEQSFENIYDPRFNGYGTSYRSYVDKLTGRPQFYYDDIDSITMPNYITRSNIDTFPWANTYGPDKIMDDDTNNEYRQLANNAFHESAIQFRTELQERLMRKRNAELWQRRVAPITTMKK